MKIYYDFLDKFWTAPELLRMTSPPPQGTQKGDVYSFAIICQEIVCREGPFFSASTQMRPHGEITEFQVCGTCEEL